MAYTIEIYNLNPVNGVFTLIDVITSFQKLTYFNAVTTAGACQFDLNVYDPKSSAQNLIRFKNHICIKDSGIIRWFGYISNINFKFTSTQDYVTVLGTTMLGHFKTRYTNQIQSYPNAVEQTSIITDIINTVQNRVNGNLGITLGTIPTTGINITATYEYAEVATLLTNFAIKPQGCEFNFVPTTNSTGIVTGIVFNMFYTKMGSVRNDLPPIQLGANGNIKQIAGKTYLDIVNNVIGIGSGTGESIYNYTVAIAGSQSTYTRKEYILTHKEISNNAQLQTLVNGYINPLAAENFQYDIDMYPNLSPNISQYSLGDSLFLNFSMPNNPNFFLNFTNKQARVIELSITVNQEGVSYPTPKLSFNN